MTVGAWLRQRDPVPPRRLAERIELALGDRLEKNREEATPACLDAAEALLRELMKRPNAGREAALDLLTVDALVTYAFEASSDSPASLESRAATAMIRLAATAAD
jgi:uncharacterized membrane protein